MKSINNYIPVKELGKGTFGIVKLVKDPSGNFYACKEVGDIIDILVGIREMDVMYRIRDLHSNLVEVHDFKIEIEEDRYNIQQIMEYCSGGSLEDLLSEEFKTPDRGINPTIGSIRNRLENLRSVVNAMVLLQERGVYHMDIKTENILYRKCKGMTPEMCLCDFSNYFFKTAWKTGMQAPIVPIEAILYRPPEIGFMTNTWDSYEKVDVWALGIAICETMGAWRNVQKVDSRVSSKTDSIKNLADKMLILQKNFLRRNPGTKGLKHPSKLIFSPRILRDGLFGADFGKGFMNEVSMEREMILSLFYAREFSKQEFFTESLECAREHFTLRKETKDLELLDRVFRELVPRCLVIDYKSRAGMRELSDILSDILNKPKLVIDNSDEKESVTQLGLWERIPDPLWKEVVLEFHNLSRDVKITYGRVVKEIPLPINTTLFAKRIGESLIEKIMVSTDNLVPNSSEERKEFYRNVLSASVFVSSELMDFIFPYESCKWFDERPLTTIAPFVKLTMDILMGEIGSLTPSEEELKAIESGTID